MRNSEKSERRSTRTCVHPQTLRWLSRVRGTGQLMWCPRGGQHAETYAGTTRGVFSGCHMRRCASRSAGTGAGCAGGQPRSQPQSLTTACSRPSAQQARCQTTQPGQAADGSPLCSTVPVSSAPVWEAQSSVEGVHEKYCICVCRRSGEGAIDWRLQPGPTGGPVGWIQALLVREQHRTRLCPRITC